ncbi:aminotransferase class I/II-fold pyridoxal phosphate-dependent enzyme [Desmospora profundinema]|uniref:Aminotransferase n=1 Tax=Desmospora profundinema TaxID=1571184 RepID=A0ABU1ILX9_9BACL|nr:aminotransferase class I/II-fold pyridoxal phosphate-dependent enzyme [Desmospora profundinema]MDR6225159.1 aspartate/methionine/tyrosine aminotransferase [Desmospora profundinema]
MNIEASQHIQRLKRGVFHELMDRKRQLASQGRSLIDLSVGSPDQPPPEFVKETIRHHAARDDAYGYTMGALPSFNHALATFYRKRYGVSLDPDAEFLQLIGSQDGLAHLATALINPGDTVLVPDPGYPIFEVGVHIAGGEPYPLPLRAENGFLPRLEEIPTEVADRAKMMVLNYPANPVTATADRMFLEEAVRFARHHEILLVQDFTYSELVFDGKDSVSLLSIPGAKEVAVEFNSLSKTFNMAGCRIGYMAGNAQVLRIMATMMSHTQYGIFLPIQKAVEAVLARGESFIAEQRKRYQHRRDALVEALADAGWNMSKPPATMYVWAPIPPGWSSVDFTFLLMEQTGVIVTPGSAFGREGEGYVRITLVQPEDTLREAASRIDTFLKTEQPTSGSSVK